MDNTKSSFLGLPVELREMIYAKVLAPSGYVTLDFSKDNRPTLEVYPTRFYGELEERQPFDDPTGRNRVSLKLLRTCKKIHEEAKEIFFDKNCLDMFWTEVGRIFQHSLFIRPVELRDVLRKHLGVIGRFKKIELGFEIAYLDRSQLSKVLATSTKLEKLTLRNGTIVSGIPFCETEALLHYATKSPGHLDVFDATLEHLSGALNRKVQKVLSFPGMRLNPPVGLFGNQIRSMRSGRGGSALPGIAKKAHAAFGGGELWVKGMLWMRDGKEVDGLDEMIKEVEKQSKLQKEKHIGALKTAEKAHHDAIMRAAPRYHGRIFDPWEEM